MEPKIAANPTIHGNHRKIPQTNSFIVETRLDLPDGIDSPKKGEHSW